MLQEDTELREGPPLYNIYLSDIMSKLKPMSHAYDLNRNTRSNFQVHFCHLRLKKPIFSSLSDNKKGSKNCEKYF